MARGERMRGRNFEMCPGQLQFFREFVYSKDERKKRALRVFKPKWEYIASKYLPKSHVTVYRDDVLRVQMQIITKRSSHYNSEKAKFFYFIDEDERTYRSEDELLGALSRKLQKEDRQRFSLLTHWVKSIED
jgi:hypothetical protein